MNSDLNAPIEGIDHVAQAFDLNIATSRGKICCPTFPAAKAGLSSSLWLREEVLV